MPLRTVLMYWTLHCCESGRFDRQITVNLPDKKGRTEILEVHARNKKLASDVNLENLAKRCPGFSGADLENVLNEAAILAVRKGCRRLSQWMIWMKQSTVL